MADRIYRLNVEYPQMPCEGWTFTEDVGWIPKDWEDNPMAWGKEADTNADEFYPFRWPANRNYLSRTGAEGRAKLFRKYGATVTVEASEPVAWGEVQ
jgi:hypothetical protein